MLDEKNKEELTYVLLKLAMLVSKLDEDEVTDLLNELQDEDLLIDEEEVTEKGLDFIRNYETRKGFEGRDEPILRDDW